MTSNVHYLVVRADGSARVTKRVPRLAHDEVAVRIRVRWPEGWGRVIRDLDVEMPAPPAIADTAVQGGLS